MPRKRAKYTSKSNEPDNIRHRGAFFVEGIPEDTKANFKAACAKNGVTMRDALIEFMRKYAVAGFGPVKKYGKRVTALNKVYDEEGDEEDNIA